MIHALAHAFFMFKILSNFHSMTLTVTQYESSAKIIKTCSRLLNQQHTRHIKKIWYLNYRQLIEIITFRLVMPKRRISIMDVALFFCIMNIKKESCTLNSAKFALFWISVEEVKIFDTTFMCLHVHELLFLKIQ